MDMEGGSNRMRLGKCVKRQRFSALNMQCVRTRVCNRGISPSRKAWLGSWVAPQGRNCFFPFVISSNHSLP